MAVRMKQYAKEFEKGYAKSGSTAKAHKTATKKAIVKPTKKKETQLEKLKRQIHMILKGPKYETPATKRHKAIQKTSQVKTTARTRSIEKSLKNSGLTPAEIKRLRGK